MSERERRDVKRMMESMSIGDLHQLLDECDSLKQTASRRLEDMQDLVTQLTATQAALKEVERDARRYWRLRVLGCAPSNSAHLERGVVMTFTNLDAHVDADIDTHPSRGEAELSKAGSR